MLRRVLIGMFAVVLAVLCVQRADLPGVPPPAVVLARSISHPPPLADRDATYRCVGCPVVLISIDALRADHLGAYGYSLPTSPNIDRYAGESVLFSNAIAAAPSTLRSHSSMFTSVFSHQHGARKTPAIALPDEALTIAEVLQGEGYATAAFVSGGQLNRVYGVDQGFDEYDVQSDRPFRQVVDDAMAWIDGAAPEQLFLFLHTYEVHAPYDPPQQYLDLLAPGGGSDAARPISIETIDQLNFLLTAEGSLDAADVARVVRSYDAEIRSVDTAFARLVQQLKQRGLYDESLILLTSDHGEEFDEHGVIGHHSHSLYEEVLKTPLIVKFPRAVFAGTTIAAQVRGIDLAPTVTKVLGIDSPPSFQGISLTGAVAGSDAGVRWSLSETGQEVPSFAVRTDRWKLYDGRLFDLIADPGERQDVSDRHPAVRSAMEAGLARFLDLPAVGQTEAVTPSEEVLKQLRALGYIRD